MALEKLGGGGVIVADEGPVGSPAQGWVSVGSLGTGRKQLAAASDSNGLIYAIGGNSLASNYETVVEQYDPSTDTWTVVASLGTGRQRLAAASDSNGLIYAIGGESSSNTYEKVVEQYDPSTDTWTTLASLATARQNLAAASDANGLIYVIGGESSTNDFEAAVEKSDFETSLVDAYTASGDTLFAIDDPNGKIENRTTGVRVTGDELVARDGETIAWFTERQARLYRTEET